MSRLQLVSSLLTNLEFRQQAAARICYAADWGLKDCTYPKMLVMLKMTQFFYMTSGSCKAFASEARQQSAAGVSQRWLNQLILSHDKILNIIRYLK